MKNFIVINATNRILCTKKSNFRKNIQAIIFSFLVLLICGCDNPFAQVFEQQRERPQSSSAYLEFFGSPPYTIDTHVEALVGYLPTIPDKDHVAPIPIFMSATSNHFQYLAQRLIDFDEEMASAMGLFNPFPRGTKIQSIRRNNDQILLDLTYHANRQTDPRLRSAMAKCLVHSLGQFHGIRSVTLSIDGMPITEGKPQPDPHEVIGPGLPRLLGVSGISSTDNKHPVLTLYFDRPVEVRELRMLDESGTLLKGIHSRILYDMALEMRPHRDIPLGEGERIRVKWQVVDALGAKGEGDTVYFLRGKTMLKRP